MSNYLIIKVMAKVVCLHFSKNGALKEISDVYQNTSLKSVKSFFRCYYECYSEDYYVELWNDFVFSVPAFNCVYVLRDLD